MQEISWHDIKFFLEVVSSGSVSKASRTLRVNQSTVSRRINAFEQSLGVKLFDRSAGAKWVVTAAGERLMSSAERMADEVNTIQREILREASEMSGLVRLTTGTYSLNNILLPVLNQFTSDHPGIELEIISTDTNLNLAAREADIAIRATNSPPDNLVGKRVGLISNAIYATPQLAERYLAGARDLPVVTDIPDAGDAPDWVKAIMPETTQFVKSNNLNTRVGMGAIGMGVVMAPTLIGEASDKLVKIADYEQESTELWVLSHVDLRTTARVRLLRDHLVEALTDPKRLSLVGHKDFNTPEVGVEDFRMSIQ